MSNIVIELLLRLVKPVAALLLALLLYAIATNWYGVAGSVELGLLCWLAGTGFILLIQESPI